MENIPWSSHLLLILNPICQFFLTVAMSPDGEKMLAVCDNGYVYIYQISDYQRIKELKGNIQFFFFFGNKFIYIYEENEKEETDLKWNTDIVGFNCFTI